MSHPSARDMALLALTAAAIAPLAYNVVLSSPRSSPAAAIRAPRSRAAVQSLRMAGTCLITDGTDSFYGSRNIFQVLHDVADYDKFVAFSSSVASAKKMCISRQARYSGLIDILEFAEGSDAELASAFDGVGTWLVMNGDTSALPAQVAAAGKAGVSRIFVHLAAADSAPADVGAVKTALEASGATFTLMRTGGFSKKGSGGGLVLGEVDLPVCDEVPLEDAQRFLVEAMGLEEAHGRSFSLCPSVDQTQLKQMRMAGCTRAEEAAALLKGVIVEKLPEERETEAEDAAVAKAKEEDPRSDEEKAAGKQQQPPHPRTHAHAALSFLEDALTHSPPYFFTRVCVWLTCACCACVCVSDGLLPLSLARARVPVASCHGSPLGPCNGSPHVGPPFVTGSQPMRSRRGGDQGAPHQGPPKGHRQPEAHEGGGGGQGGQAQGAARVLCQDCAGGRGREARGRRQEGRRRRRRQAEAGRHGGARQAR